jgi:uncharacterized protein (UPF0261 family)
MELPRNSGAPAVDAPIFLIGTLDTKGEEIEFVRSCLTRFDLRCLVIDVGVLGEPQCAADIAREEIAALGGGTIEDLVAKGDRGGAIVVMQHGLATWMRAHVTVPPAGVLAIGGSAGTLLASAGMRELPIGVPKVLVSTMASGDVRPYVGTSDIAMMYSVGDFTGLNRLTRRILHNAAGAVAGMCLAQRQVATEPKAEFDSMLVGVTMFGVTTPYVRQVQQLLAGQGFELLVFHATGTGGQAMERLVTDGFIQATLDLTTTELADELVGGVLSAGPNRLEEAGRIGIPQIISVGALDMVNFGSPDTVPHKFDGRTFYPHNPAVTLMRTTTEENSELGKMIARKANAAKGPIKILLPLRGVSALDAEGKPFFDPLADQALFAAIRGNLQKHVELIELDMHINDLAFAERTVCEFLSAIAKKRPVQRNGYPT